VVVALAGLVYTALLAAGAAAAGEMG